MKAAVYCGTRNIYQDMIPSMKSLLKYSDVDKIYFLIEDDQFPYELPSEVECINVSNQKWFYADGPNFTSKWSYMILLRAALAKIFPHLDKILSLDCDTLVQDNISELWQLPLDNYYFAAVREPKKSTDNFVYINAGVMMFNLKKIREEHQDDKYIHDLNNCFRYFPEQECFSALSQGMILELPSQYNLSCVSLPSIKEKIVHFAAHKQWSTLKIVEEYRNLPLKIERNQQNQVDLNNTYTLFTFSNITQKDIDTIIATIKNYSTGYVFLWNNCLVLKNDFIKRYNIDINQSILGLIHISRIILSYLYLVDYCNRIFIFDDQFIIMQNLYSQMKDSVNETHYLINKCKELKIPMRYVIKELNYTIVYLYLIFLLIIQKEQSYIISSWNIIKEFYNKYYSKYELAASETLQEVYYKTITPIIKNTEFQKNEFRININRFLSELKTESELPRRYRI